MFKYNSNGHVKTARSLDEAIQRLKRTLPREKDPLDCFVVRTLLYDNEDQDYSVEYLGRMGHQVFENYVDAYDFFEKLVKDNFMINKYPEVKVDLCQHRYGHSHTLHSKIVFPGGGLLS